MLELTGALEIIRCDPHPFLYMRIQRPTEVWFSRASLVNGGKHEAGTRSPDCRPTELAEAEINFKKLVSRGFLATTPCLTVPASVLCQHEGLAICSLSPQTPLPGFRPGVIPFVYLALIAWTLSWPPHWQPWCSWSPPLKTHKTFLRHVTIIPKRPVLMTSDLF